MTNSRNSWRVVLLPILTLALIAAVDSAWPPTGLRYASLGYANLPGAALSDGAGGAIFIWTRWTDSSSSHTELRAQRIDANGTPMWGGPDEGIVVCDAPNTRYDPKFIGDGTGGFFACWLDQRAAPQAYATRFLRDGSLAPGWPANGLRIAPTGGTQFDADLASDSSGGLYVLWSDWRGGLAGSDIYAQRVMGDGTIAPSWPPDGMPVCTAPGGQDEVCVITDGHGGVIGCWRDTRAESTESNIPLGDIFAQRVLPNGAHAAGWPDDGLAVGATPSPQDMPTIVSDQADGAIICWRDYREDSVTPHVYAARVSGDGEPLWGANGSKAGSGLNFEWIPTMVSDGSGGAYIVRGGGQPGVASGTFLSHLGPDGLPVLGWGQGGLPVSGLRARDRPILAADQVGGVFVAWSEEDESYQNDNIRIQRFTRDGLHAKGWPDSGIVVSDRIGYRETDPAWPGTHGGPIVADGEGGVIASWFSREGGTITASAIRLNGRGRIVVVTPGVPGAALLTFGPNPAKGTGSVTLRLPSDGRAWVGLYDVLGRKYRELEVSGAPDEIRVVPLDLTGLRSGTYMVRFADRHRRLISSRKLAILR